MIHFHKSLLRNYLKEFPAFSGILEAVDVMENWEVLLDLLFVQGIVGKWLPWDEDFH